MKQEPIFIHVPKTGGTTINCLIQGSDWQTTPDYHYRHIDRETLLSNSGDIFDPEQVEKYKSERIFLFLRSPIDRLTSEYYFIKDRNEFIGQIKPLPKNLKQYIQSQQTANYMCKFLLGWKMYDKREVRQEHLDQLLNAIETLDIKVGIFEHYDLSLDYFSACLKMKFPKQIEKKRVTLNRPAKEDLDEGIKNLIIKTNDMDMQLYAACLKRFQSETSGISQSGNYDFTGDEYNYIMKYTQRFCLINIASDNSAFETTNAAFFDDMNKYLHFESGISDGEYYVINWNQYVISALKSALLTHSGDEGPLSGLQAIEDPLEQCKALSNSLRKVTGQKTDLGRFSPFSIRLQKPSRLKNLRKRLFG